MESSAHKDLETAAAAGDVKAMTNLGLSLYRNGNKELASSWWRKATHSGDVAAMNNLGLLQLETTKGVEGYLWVLRAADGGHLPAMRTVGFWFLENDYRGRAERWFEKGASLGDIESSFRLADLYRARGKSLHWDEHPFEPAKFWQAHADVVLEKLVATGLDSDEWFERAKYWPIEDYTESFFTPNQQSADRSAAEAGDVEAMNRLGYLAQGTDDIPAAIHWWERASQSGHATAMSNLGFLYESQGNMPEAIDLWLAAVKGGCCVPVDSLTAYYRDHAMADEAVQLGKLLFGESPHLEPVLSRGDVEGASELFVYAASQGDTDALWFAAQLAFENEDFPGAHDFWKQAAQKDHVGSMIALGVLWFESQIDEWEAEQWLKKAADLGSHEAVELLVRLYESGACVGSQVAEDVSWWTTQAKVGIEDARRYLESLGGATGTPAGT